VVSIRLLQKKVIIFISAFILGICIILFSIVQLNKTYAIDDLTQEVELSSIVPFYWMILIIGGIIVIALSYVGWRKYRGHKLRQKRDTNN